MPYLDAVLKESLRLFPSVPAILREMKEDIEINGYKIPNGSDISISLVALHRDPEVYPDPLAFKPERWLNKQVPLDEKPFCFIPFSGSIGDLNSIRTKTLALTAHIKYQWIIDQTTKLNIIYVNNKTDENVSSGSGSPV